MKKIAKFLLLLAICFTILVIHPKKIWVEDWINVTQFGTDSRAIQKALNIAKEKGKVNIIIPNGVYDIKNTLVIYKNTRIKMEENTVLMRKHPGTLIRNGKAGDQYTGYEGNGNIIIEGGTLDGNYSNSSYSQYGYGGLSFAHAKNLIIRDVTIKDIVFAHGMEINSSYNVLIEDCVFIGFKDNTANGSRNYSEAVQIDLASHSGFPDFGSWDYTPSKQVTIRNNYFGNSTTEGMEPWPVGIGGHGGQDHIWNEDINIYNNTFDGMTFAGVRPYKWRNVEINNNTYNNSKIPILVETNNQNVH